MPFFLETDIIQPVPDKVLDFVKNHRVPLKRLGQPEEAAKPFFGYCLRNLLLSMAIPLLWMVAWKLVKSILNPFIRR